MQFNNEDILFLILPNIPLQSIESLYKTNKDIRATTKILLETYA